MTWIIDVHDHQRAALVRLRGLEPPVSLSSEDKAAWLAARDECVRRVQAMPDGQATHVHVENNQVSIND